jgi:hypothetical protein
VHSTGRKSTAHDLFPHKQEQKNGDKRKLTKTLIKVMTDVRKMLQERAGGDVLEVG